MGEEKHIDYSQADIERYHKKLMSAKEMHALEKAALDDPFLADALEGYVMAATDASGDLASLRNQLNERITKEAKVIPLGATRIPWLRIAALVIIIAGAGLLAYQFVFTNKNKDVAEAKEAKKETTAQPVTADSLSEKTADVKEDSTPAASNNDEVEKLVSNAASGRAKETAESKSTVADDRKGYPEAAVAPSVDAAEENSATVKKEPAPKEQEAIALDTKEKDKQAAVQYKYETVEKARGKKAASQLFEQAQSNRQQQANIFRGQVLDANRTPLPFANVTNTKDNVGTYTDVKGYFTLISPDSSLNIRVRSVGFENSNSQLQNTAPLNAIVLQSDTSVPSTLVSNKKINADRVRKSTLTVEEPEPYDGWYNYDTYLANNIVVPEERKREPTGIGEVELSFDISKNGEPINIKIEKSACKECDAEAIRLLKEGPKWKKKNKNKRARLNVAF